MNPVVSIIIPMHNSEKYIRECIESVQQQTLNNIEIICIDDGSTDDTFKIVQSLSMNDLRIKLYSQSNMGPGCSRNRGVEEAHADYIAFLDSDDCYDDPVSLEKMVFTCDKYDVDICKADLIIVDDELNLIKTNVPGQIKEKKEQIVYFKDYQQDYYFSSYIYRRDFITGNEIKFPPFFVNEDPPFLARALSISGKFAYVPITFYDYRQYKNSSSRNVKHVYEFLLGAEECLGISVKNDYQRLFDTWVRRIDDKCGEILEGMSYEVLLEIANIRDKYCKNVNMLIYDEIVNACKERGARKRLRYGNAEAIRFYEREDTILKVKKSLDDRSISALIIYGAGKNGWRLYQILKKLDIRIIAVVDKEKKEMDGVQVLRINEIRNKEECIIVSPKNGDDIMSELKKQGYKNVFTLAELIS